MGNFSILPDETALNLPSRVAISPSFHTDTLIDCRYSTLDIALLTFRLAAIAKDITLSLHDGSGHPGQRPSPTRSAERS